MKCQERWCSLASRSVRCCFFVVVASQHVIFFNIRYMKSTVHVLLRVKLALAIWHISFPVSGKALHLACCCTQPFLYRTSVLSLSLSLSGRRQQIPKLLFTQFSKILHYRNLVILHVIFPPLLFSTTASLLEINPDIQILGSLCKFVQCKKCSGCLSKSFYLEPSSERRIWGLD